MEISPLDNHVFQKSDTTSFVEVIDVDAIDPHMPSPSFALTTSTTNMTSGSHLLSSSKTPHPKHRRNSPSLSSIDSTGRLERQLFSARGEELACFDPKDTNTLHQQQHQHHKHGQEDKREVARNTTQGIDTQGMGPELALALGGGLSAPKTNTHEQRRGPEQANVEGHGEIANNSGSWHIERTHGKNGRTPGADKCLDPTVSDFEPMGKRKREVALECNMDDDMRIDGYEIRRGKREKSETRFEGEEKEGSGELEREVEMEGDKVVVCMRGG